MSWLIQSLLNDKMRIKETMDLESDEYNDLLLVEKAIGELEKMRLLSSEDIQVIEYITGELVGFVDMGKVQKEGIRKRFTAICQRLAFYLGDYFTDEGYLEYMREKYQLGDEEMDCLRTYIGSVFRHKIIRKGFLHNRELKQEQIKQP